MTEWTQLHELSYGVTPKSKTIFVKVLLDFHLTPEAIAEDTCTDYCTVRSKPKAGFHNSLSVLVFLAQYFAFYTFAVKRVSTLP